MLIEPMGHAQFLLTNRYGDTVLTDPFDRETGYPWETVTCDVVTVSHSHHDHADLGKCRGREGNPIVIDREGWHSPLPDVTVQAVPTFHDDCGGQKRGRNLMMLIEMDGLRLLHCGDLGHLLPEETIASLGRVDVLLIPVGGFFTLSPESAARTVEAIRPRVTVPMHYRTACNASWPIETAEPFLDLMGATEAEREPMPMLRVTAGDLSQQKRICVLEAKQGKKQ